MANVANGLVQLQEGLETLHLDSNVPNERLHVIDTCWTPIAAQLSVVELLQLGACCSVLLLSTKHDTTWTSRLRDTFGELLTCSLLNNRTGPHQALYRKLSTLEALHWSCATEALPARSGHFAGFVAGAGLYIGAGVGKDVSGMSYVDNPGVVEDGRLFDVQVVLPTTRQKSEEIAESARLAVCQWGGTSAVVGHKMYLCGGYENEPLVIFDTTESSWKVPEVSGCNVPGRYEQTVVAYDDTLIYFGGKPPFEGSEDDFTSLNAVVALDVTRLHASMPATGGESPMPRHAHSSAVVGSSMAVVGGYFYEPDEEGQAFDYEQAQVGIFGLESTELDSEDEEEGLEIYEHIASVTLLNLDTW